MPKSKPDPAEPDPKQSETDDADDNGDNGDDLETQLAAAKAEEIKWRGLSRKNEAKAKANADAAKRLKELEDGDKSEIQKLTDRANEATAKVAEAESRADKAELDVLRISVGASKGLTPSQASRLRGTDEAEFGIDADELIASFTPDDDPKKPPVKRPATKLKGGDDPEDEPEESDPIKLIEDVPR